MYLLRFFVVALSLLFFILSHRGGKRVRIYRTAYDSIHETFGSGTFNLMDDRTGIICTKVLKKIIFDSRLDLEI